MTRDDRADHNTRPRRILFFQNRDSAYTASLFAALQKNGTPVLSAEFAGRWLWNNTRSGDLALLHWPSFFYRGQKSLIATIKSIIRFFTLVLLVRIKGARWIWVAHNVLPHDQHLWPWLDILARYFVIQISSAVLAHGHHASRALIRHFPSVRKKVRLIPHGNWVDEYPNTISQAEARKRLGLHEQSKTLLFIGACKPYKRLLELVQLFKQTSVADYLLIAGKFQDLQYENKVKLAIQDDPRIVLHSKFIPDDELQIYISASDALIAPYREILTSGTAMLALSFGKPIVSTRIGFLQDVIDDECGVLFNPNDDNELLGAIRHVLERRYVQSVILTRAHAYTFEAAAQIIAEL